MNKFHPSICGPYYRLDLLDDNGDIVDTMWINNINAPAPVPNGTASTPDLPVVEGPVREKHNFGTYAWNWFELYSKPNIESSTAVSYEQQLRNHIIPAFGDKNLEDITVDEIQLFFNNLDLAKVTKSKIKLIMAMIYDTAVEDGLVERNPLASKRLKIVGNASKATPVYTVEQMRYLVQHISSVKDPQERAYLALQALHPLRLEEVLGLKWSDIDLDNTILHVRRAVTHPKRNLPEVKSTKTKSSIRDIGLSQIAAQYLVPGKADDFVIGGKSPLTYSSVKTMCRHIQRDTGFSEKVTPIRFRTTVLTDIYNTTKDITEAQAAAGHTSSTTTLEHYVRGRGTPSQSASAIDAVYGAPEEKETTGGD